MFFKDRITTLSFSLKRINSLKSEIELMDKYLLDFFNWEFSSQKTELPKIIQEKNKILIKVNELYGFENYLLNELLKTKKFLFFEIPYLIRDSFQLCYALLKEMQIESKNPEEDFFRIFKENKDILILKGISNIVDNEFKNFLRKCEDFHLICIDEKKEELEDFHLINIEACEIEKIMDLACVLYGHNRGSEIRYQRDFQLIFNIFSSFPKFIFSILVFIKYKKYNFSKFVKELEKNSKDPIKSFFNVIIKNLSKEALFILKNVLYLSNIGFSVEQIYRLCKDKFPIKKDFESIFDFLAKLLFFERKRTGIIVIYTIPEFIQKKLKQLINLSFSSSEINNLNLGLLSIVKDQNLKIRKTLWLSQIEECLDALKKSLERNIFWKENLKASQTLYIETLFFEMHYIDEIRDFILPLCHREIAESKNNEERGSWYNLLGTVYKDLSIFSNKELNLELALSAFQKSLKFYDHEKEKYKYSFSFEQIGRIYIELAEHTINEKASLNAAIKALGKALSFEQEASKRYINLILLLAETYIKLGKIDDISRLSEHSKKSLYFYSKILKFLELETENTDKIKFYRDYISEKLKILNIILFESISNTNKEEEKNTFMFLNKEISKILNTNLSSL